jgi:phospho-N-acetylmuramoyl-pentapeptide-transferase
LGILAGATAGLWVACDYQSASLWGVALALGAVSFLDDRRGLGIGTRLVAQLAAAAAVLALIASGQPAWWVVGGFFATVWMTNLYNFMDGADGLAGGMGAIGFGAYAAGAALAEDVSLATLTACVAVGCLLFLVYNYAPARIFMGDVGSTVLGFAAGSLGLLGESLARWPIWFPFMVFLPFIADASVTLLRRVCAGEKAWRPHREHYYQRLIRSGWMHARMAKTAYALMVGTAGSGVVTLALAPGFGWTVLALWGIAIGALMFAVDARWSRFMDSHDATSQKLPT